MGSKICRHIALILLCLVAAALQAQDNYSRNLSNFRETVWLSSDRNLFLSGEAIQFRARVMEQDTYQESFLSRNLRIELLNPDGNPLVQQNLVLKDGMIEGILLLPADAQTGWYYIRAYTNWMRNFDAGHYASLALKVVNTRDNYPRSISRRQEKISVKLYPRGNSTGIYAGYQGSQGLGLKGWIIEISGDTLAPFTTHSSGWTIIDKELQEEKSYIIRLDGLSNTLYSESPEIIKKYPAEISLRVSDFYIEATVSGKVPVDWDQIRLIAHQSYTSYWTSEPINIAKANFRIPRSALPGGIVQFSIVSSDNQLLTCRLWSALRSEPVNINLSGDKDSLELRSRSTCDFSVQAESAGLSIFIGMAEPDHPLKKFLPGMPGWPCSSAIPNDQKAFDGWLLGNAYPDNAILSILDPVREDAGKSQFNYLPETRSGVLSGKVVEDLTGLGVGNIGVSVTVPNNNYFDACTTDDKGRFYFALPDQKGAVDVILNFTGQVDSGLQIMVTPGFEPPYGNTLSSFGLSDEEVEFLETLNINLQIQNIYDILPEYAEPEAAAPFQRETFFHPPDITVVLEDYIKLANIREVVYEVVPTVAVRSSGGHDFIRVINDNPYTSDFETLVLLDGIPLPDPTELMQLSPDRIEKIEVKNRLYLFGRNIYSAIVNFVSPNNDYAGLDLNESSVLLTLNLPRDETLVKMVPVPVSLNIPILESTLVWEFRELTGNSTVDFSTNDAAGKYQINISGFDNQGVWIFGSREFTTVKDFK